MSSKEITFYNSHRPVLQDGDYELKLEHDLELSTIAKSIPTKDIEFFVSGPRFAIEPSLVHSSYPPTGGKGDYRATLPTLVLNRSTLPWERSPVHRVASDEKHPITPAEENASWLFLLLIDESEAHLVKQHNSTSLSELKEYFVSPKNDKVPLSALDLKRLPPKINYITLDSSLNTLDKHLIPHEFSDLEYLSYARIKEGEEEQAVILCNRLPKAGSSSTVYLVSLENNYVIDSSTGDISFNGIIDANSNLILPCLHKWSFKAFDDQLYCITGAVAKKITASISSVKAPLPTGLLDVLKDNTTDFIALLNNQGITDSTKQKTIAKLAKLPGSDFHELLSHLSNGFSPLSISGSSTKPLYRTGAIEFPFHELKKGTDSWLPAPGTCWYRGPLTAACINLSQLENFSLNAPTHTNPQQPADLLITNTSDNVVDVSYAAAFELGRLTALDNVAFATEFYKWKNQVATIIRMNHMDDTCPLAPVKKTAQPAIPENLINQFRSWQALKGIPYRYLIPDPRLLPEESIRFFYLDPYWVRAFTCGAFSIGHTLSADLNSYLNILLNLPRKRSMGFLINSFAVSGWPSFQVDVHIDNASTETITHQNKNNLDVNVAFFLFDKSFTKLRFHLHHAKVHSGLLYEDPGYKKYMSKKLSTKSQPINITLTNQTIDPSSIAENLKTNDPAHFAAAMLEGEEIVEFIIS